MGSTNCCGEGVVVGAVEFVAFGKGVLFEEGEVTEGRLPCECGDVVLVPDLLSGIVGQGATSRRPETRGEAAQEETRRPSY